MRRAGWWSGGAGGEAHAPAARAAREGGECSSRQLLRARERGAHCRQCIGVDSAARTPHAARLASVRDSDIVCAVNDSIVLTACDHDVLCVTHKDVQWPGQELTEAPPGDEKLCYATDRGDYPDLGPKNTMHACGNREHRSIDFQWSYSVFEPWFY